MEHLKDLEDVYTVAVDEVLDESLLEEIDEGGDVFLVVGGGVVLGVASEGCEGFPDLQQIVWMPRITITPQILSPVIQDLYLLLKERKIFYNL